MAVSVQDDTHEYLLAFEFEIDARSADFLSGSPN
jgi:hypothetical protein